MKTFTNYAEKKAKQFLNLLQGYTKGIRITAILILLLMGVSNAWAAVNHTGGYVYFLKPSTWTGSKVMMFIGHDNYTSVFEMTKVSNTDNLYHYEMPSWSNATYVAFANAGNVWGSGNWGPNNRTNATHYTNVYNNYGFNSGSYYVVVPASTNNNASIAIYYTGTTASSVNRTTKAIASDKAHGTVSVSGYYMSNATTASTRSAVSSTASNATASTTLAPGSTATFKATASTGYEFAGWYDAATGGNQLSSSTTYDFKYDISYTDKIVYGRFRAKTYKVTLDASGGTGGTGSVTATYNAAMPSATMPTRNGYTFKGYYDAQSGGTKYYNANGSSAKNWDKTAATTLYAQWELATYTITYDNLKGATHTNPATYTINSATITFTAPTSKPVGYTFANWSPTSIVTGSTGNKTVTANWTAATSTITLSQEEATEKGTTSVTATYGSAMPAITKPSRTGYTFAGYYTEKNGGGTQYYKADGTSATTWNLEGAQTLYAQWTINQYTINYGVVGSANGAIQLDGGTKVTTSSSTTANYNTSHTFTAEPANDDYKIEGWYSDANGANKIDAAGTYNAYEIASLTADTYVYVKFVETAEVMSQVDVTATEGGTVSPSGTVEVGNRTPTTFTATPDPGYRFDQWTYNVGVIKKTENNTNEQGSITITATSTGTLTARFVRVYTVNFFATPAAAGIATATVNGDAINSGDEFGAGTEITFTADVANAYNGQCTFQRWVDGAGETLSTETTYIHTVQEDITVKAIFKITQYTLTFSAGDGGFVSAKANNSNIASPANLDYNTSVTLTAEPDAGCAFVKWVNENGTQLSTNSTYTIKLTAAKTVKAVFAQGTTVYLKPVDWWKNDDARFAVYMWKDGGNEWREMEDLGCNGDIYTIDIPHGYTKLIFARLKPVTDAEYDKNDEWKNVWNQTEDLTVPTGNKNTYDMNAKSITNLYLKPHDNWKQADARFAAYFFVNSYYKWVDMKHVKDGIYKCTIPTDKAYTTVIYGRMNPGTNTNNFDNGTKWNQTGNLTIPKDGTNCYTLTGGEWDGVTGEWSTIYDDSKWTTYSAPSYKIKINTATNGTIQVTKADGTAVTNNSSLALGTEIKIVFTPNDGYKLSNYFIEYATATDKADGYTICGPTEITAEFDKEVPSRIVYLRPNEDWLRDNPVMAARVRKSSGGNDKWYVMHTTSEDYTGAYSCNIPNDYDKIIFVRLNPKGSDAANDGFNWTNAWNQTKELTIIDKDDDKTNDHKLRFAIGDKIVGENDNDRYDGKWEENTPIWGLTANFNDWTAEKAVFKGYPGHLDVMPPFGTSHAFKLYNFVYANNKYFGNAGTMKRANSGQWWTMDASEQANCKMILDVKGDYIYQMRFLTVGSELRKQISVTYPEADNKYALLYKDDNVSRISYDIPDVNGEQNDTISFFVDRTANPTIKLLVNTTETGDDIQVSVSESGVYNFVLQQNGGEVTVIATNPEPYKGNYYIRTDAASGGWGGYKQNGNKMTYTSYADNNHNFDHYYCKWVESSQSSYANVKFCVANDYSHKLSDELDGDEIIEKAGVHTGCLPEDANVRFGWDSKTNELSRAYISGSSNASDRFLVLTGNEYLLDIAGESIPVGTGDRAGLLANEDIFDDMGNWVYQLDVRANKQTAIKLTAKFNNRVQTFFGDARAAEGVALVMDATSDEYYKVRMIYNFKTNHLLAAWLLDREQEINKGEITSNVLIIREDHGDANQLQFNNDLTEMTINTAYAAMTFTEDHVTESSLSQWQRYEYWVSFPFNVKISDVFGFGEYGTDWIMQLYDGAERAEKGNWVDSPTFWKYITNRNYTLQAGVGYVLKLQASRMTDETAFKYSDKVSLYFPSTPNNAGNTIISATPDTQHEIDEHECTIDRDNRKIYDSHWNLIGVPGYANIATFNTDASLSPVEYKNGEVSFYYEYNAANNTYQATSKTSNFKNMHSYMVQFAGTINWSTKEAVKPAELAARRNSDAEPEKVSLRLELAQDEVMADQTFVQLQQEGATAEFDMNLDLTKIINSGANIYTLAGEQRIQSAGNALPMGEAIVPVGVKIDAEGEYTFRMPDGTEGMVVELIDYERDITTNLLLFDYTVTLPAGSNESRFALHIQPNKSGVTTGVENVGDKAKGIEKYLIDGKLMIRTAEGVIYDAQGHVVQ